MQLSVVSFKFSFRQLPATQLRMRNRTSAFTLSQHKLDEVRRSGRIQRGMYDFKKIFYCLLWIKYAQIFLVFKEIMLS